VVETDRFQTCVGNEESIREGQSSFAAISSHGVNIGLDLEDPWNLRVFEDIRRSESYEPESTELILNYPRSDDTLLDLGANIGYLTLLAARIVGGEVRSIRLNLPAVRRLLMRNLALSQVTNVRVHPEALSNRYGIASFFVSNGDTSLNNLIGPIGPKPF